MSQNQSPSTKSLHGCAHEKRSTFLPLYLTISVDGICWSAPRDHDAAHWDGDPTNNCLDNLRWATVSENMSDKKRHGTDSSGTRNAMSKLTDEQVLYIRRNYKRILYHKSNALELAERFNVSRTVILQIANNKRWAHLPQLSCHTEQNILPFL